MEYFHVVLTSLFSIAALFVITKLLGYRQMSQLSMFDYINGITIGSVSYTHLDVYKRQDLSCWSGLFPF